MQISVVIPSHNRRELLTRALQSVLLQTSAVDEIIVIDDGSSDATAAMVETDFPQVILLQQENCGVSAARNRGIETARFEWIALLDSDDSWFPHKVESIRNAYRQNNDFILFHSDEIWIRNGRRVNPMNKHRKRGGWIFDQCLALCAISPSTVVMRKSVLNELGKFNEGLPACEDYDLWLRLSHRYPVYCIDQALVTRYGGHDDQLSSRYTAMDRFRIRALHGLLKSEQLKFEHHRAALGILQQKLEILLNGARKHGNQEIIDEFSPIREEYYGSDKLAC